MPEITEELRCVVIEAMKRQGIEDPYFAQRARMRRCAQDDRRPYKFRGAKNGECWVGYICDKCRVLTTWNIACPQGATMVQL